ncbi:hypothetical protein ON010_g12318 [Phytophthora cinnamomi]|nr:hypothetical protein ON010_g12318 [Phytophthora cinnamomi]
MKFLPSIVVLLAVAAVVPSSATRDLGEQAAPDSAFLYVLVHDGMLMYCSDPVGPELSLDDAACDPPNFAVVSGHFLVPPQDLLEIVLYGGISINQ